MGSCGVATGIFISPISRLIDGGPLLFDAIEFDPVIATTDVLYDLAFTLMDIVHFDRPAAANAVFNRYLAAAGDENLDGLRVLPLFLSMRAAIRAHVIFIKSEQTGGEAASGGRPSDISIWPDASSNPIRQYWWRSAACQGRESRFSHAGSRARSASARRRHCPLGCRSQTPLRRQ